mmetsp:Transcript_55450/g.113112  ORF Transcript_55450/g.113112 Transcript_55450/m.113112 type:complete len:294 (-) Transcript_55450:465-1346(-)
MGRRGTGGQDPQGSQRGGAGGRYHQRLGGRDKGPLPQNTHRRQRARRHCRKVAGAGNKSKVSSGQRRHGTRGPAHQGGKGKERGTANVQSVRSRCRGRQWWKMGVLAGPSRRRKLVLDRVGFQNVHPTKSRHRGRKPLSGPGGGRCDSRKAKGGTTGVQSALKDARWRRCHVGFVLVGIGSQEPTETESQEENGRTGGPRSPAGRRGATQDGRTRCEGGQPRAGDRGTRCGGCGPRTHQTQEKEEEKGSQHFWKEIKKKFSPTHAVTCYIQIETNAAPPKFAVVGGRSPPPFL